MKTISMQNVPIFKRLWYSIGGYAKKVQLIGMTGSGKTTILNVIYKKMDVAPDEVQKNTGGKNKCILEYETQEGQHFLIKSWDIAGREKIYNDGFVKSIIEDSRYFIYCINADFYLRVKKGFPLSELNKKLFSNPQESCYFIDVWLDAMDKQISKHNEKQKMIIVATHVDEYLQYLNKPVNNSYRNMVLDELRKIALKNYNAYWTYAIDATKYEQVQEVFDSFLKK